MLQVTVLRPADAPDSVILTGVTPNPTGVPTVIVQIYTVQTAAEALALAGLGVDRIGVTPSAAGLPGEVSHALAREIFQSLGERATKVALSVDQDIDAIAAMVRTVAPDVLHLCGDLDRVPVPALRRLRGLVPGVAIMQAIPVTGPQAVAQAQAFARVSDLLILDSQSPAIGGIGAAGTVHDWAISRRIVQSVTCPVILAGGLSPANVAEAIRIVRPWGVDSLTHTNEYFRDGGFRKDLDKVAAFVSAARRAGPQGRRALG